MGDVRFKDNAVLFDSNAVAMDANCCCDVCDCGGSVTATIDNVVNPSNCAGYSCDQVVGSTSAVTPSQTTGPCCSWLWNYTSDYSIPCILQILADGLLSNEATKVYAKLEAITGCAWGGLEQPCSGSAEWGEITGSVSCSGGKLVGSFTLQDKNGADCYVDVTLS